MGGNAIMGDNFMQNLIDLGIDATGALERFAGHQDMYLKWIFKFLDDENYDQAQKFYQLKDWKSMLFHIHNLKGVTGNLGMNRLYRLCHDMVIAIRAEDFQTVESLDPMFVEEYRKVCSTLKSLQEKL